MRARRINRQDLGAGCLLQPLAIPGLWLVLLGQSHDGYIEDNQPRTEGWVGVELKLEGAGVRPGSGGGAEVETWMLSGLCNPSSACSKSNIQGQGWGTKWGRGWFWR